MLASEFLQTYGINKSLLLHLTQQKKHISIDYQDLFPYYKLLFWENQYILRAIKEGYIERDGKLFIVIFHKSRGMLVAEPYGQSQLSFREPIPESGIPAYCLIF